ncbi:nuclear transport factor 2 family protein [Anaeromyxobacter sp. PSR-1]|uniref:nuclear transport factor 2 family protein n=1 Tax=unclassified Anaeromyxobacter TaxID=2620896 RepID=UPI0005E707D6|nr:nuclear transport factor 2 family protein [Anaeromyxobacter sp. PSR-1]GAO05005.1 snoaL-like domain protein [Anaeromyxobacter sp. PSR-1]
MTRDEMDRLVNRHFQQEAQDDLEGVLSTFTEDLQHRCVGSTCGPLSGKEAARGFYRRLFADLRGEGVRPIARRYGEDFLVDEAEWTGTVADASFCGLAGWSGRATFRMLHVFELRGERISREELWFDVAALRAQLAPPARAQRGDGAAALGAATPG